MSVASVSRSEMQDAQFGIMLDRAVACLNTENELLRREATGLLKHASSAVLDVDIHGALVEIAGRLAVCAGLNNLITKELHRFQELEKELHIVKEALSQARTQASSSDIDVKHVWHLAYHDALTGLPNRLLLNEQITNCLRHLPAIGFAIFYIDLNDFKSINDEHGHATGDVVLKIVAARLRSALRSMDTVSRIGGDEFVCLIRGVNDRDQLASLAIKLFAAVAAPEQIGPLNILTGASVGIAVHPQDGNSVQELLGNADTAMYYAKQHHLGCAFVDQARKQNRR